MREVEDGAARRLIDAPILHADQPVLDDVDDADAVRAADGVQLLDDLAGLHLLAVERDGRAGLKVDGDVGGLVRRLERRNAHLEEAGLVVIRLVRGIFKVESFMAQMPQVLVLGIVRLAADLQRHIVRLCIVDLFLSGLDVPLAPRRDDLHIRGEALDRQLKPDLIVALAGRAVRDGVRALGEGDLGQLLADDRSCKGRAQQVGLILGVHLHRRNDDLVDHLVDQIGDDQLACAGLEGLFFESIQLVALADVCGHRDDLRIVVVFLQPRDDDRRVQSARVSQHDLLDFILIHIHFPPFDVGWCVCLCAYYTPIFMFVKQIFNKYSLSMNFMPDAQITFHRRRRACQIA